ncbi:MAG: NAD(P)H-quinone oxidoreductase subunit 4 [Pseudanabaenaceae cyanobacterium SKYGB_i_bin29]|nr:NAD(P)H-quinone oxidoreductase subunit 4 [Pseudanabaenaceae cyanobacterium SKYG29]MDW8420761.1 NAD(P)H-quinone oxidoreductase subunit 4 [Pseudanabaenaceae cyanobacterium SKYGB_i_bin29]
MQHFPWLTTIILLPLVAALLIPVLPDKEGKNIRWYSLGVALLDFVLMVYALWRNYDPTAVGWQMVDTLPWLPQLGLYWSVGVDGISLWLVLLAGLVTTLGIFAAWQVDHKPRLFHFLMLVLYGAQIGVFVAKDMLLFFLLWEIELIPVYLLISIWGGAKRRYAATKFLLYTAASSVFILLCGLAMAFSGETSFDIAQLATKDYPLTLQLFLYAGLLIAFGTKLAVFPLHTWLPDAHGEASAPVSMILAGVLLKMGGYGLARFNLEALSDAHIYFAPVLAILGVVNIIYGACSSLGQGNMKRRLAYSSISHMGFVLVGLASFSDLGMSGALLQMISHGLIAAALFYLAGVTYDRTHTLAMAQMGGIARSMPKTFALFTAAAMASLALPGMSGFASELSVFVGFTANEVYGDTFRTVTVLLAAVGLILTPVYLLSMLRQVFYGQPVAQMVSENRGANCFGHSCALEPETIFTDAKPREVFIALCFLVPVIAVGLYPKLCTTVFDAKTVAVNAEVRHSFATSKLPAFAARTAPLVAELR